MDAQNVKGTRDILLEEGDTFSHIENLLMMIASLHGYHELRTPILEHSEVFARGVGEGSDIVRKEMYTFLDKAERSVTMRPEFTAGIVRSVVQNKMYANYELPLKICYKGPAFRYERPQLGRYRQFNQIGVESIGNNSLYNDFEVILLAYNMLKALGLDNVTLKINCLGDALSRNNYRNALKAYFLPHLEHMCSDCKQRYELNPLRILDCKVPEDKVIAKGAPKIKEYLSEQSRDRFNKIKSLLDDAHIKYEEDDQLVRGLDYYSEIVFEFAYISKKGFDYGALGGGGHYGNLVKELGGPDLSGVGFSFGIERLYDILIDDGIITKEMTPIHVYMMPLGEEYRGKMILLANSLRHKGIITDICFDDVKLGNMFKRANKKKAKFALILGENEYNNHKIVVKDLEKEEQVEIDIDEVENYLLSLFNQKHQCRCHNGEYSDGGCCKGDHHEGECCDGECD